MPIPTTANSWSEWTAIPLNITYGSSGNNFVNYIASFCDINFFDTSSNLYDEGAIVYHKLQRISGTVQASVYFKNVTSPTRCRIFMISPIK